MGVSLREDLLKSRYLMDGEAEDQMWRRVTAFVIQDDPDLMHIGERIYEALRSGQIVFNSPLLMNAGTKQPLASACFVYGVEDSIESIMNLQSVAARIFKLGAGIGVDYSKLRPEDEPVHSGGTASGPCSFMTLVDHLAEVIKSGGRRRAAIMSTLNVTHPDVMKFIQIKKDDKTLQNTNISVMMNDDFMRKAQAGTLTGTQKEIWKSLVHNAWLRGDPGLVFLSTINRNTHGVVNRTYEAVNACSEFPLYAGESCLIGTINLGHPTMQTSTNISFWSYWMTRILDNVIDHAWYPLPEIEAMAKKYRRVGVSITGLGDYLIRRGVRYGSLEAINEVTNVVITVRNATTLATEQLAEIKGAFPEFGMFKSDQRIKVAESKPRRNLTVTTIAPAGSTSFLCGADCSGIEPLFAVAYQRMARLEKGGDTWYDMVSPIAQEVFNKHGIKLTKELLQKIYNNHGSIQGIEEIPEKVQKFLVTAHDVTPMEHLEMLGTVQQHIEAAVSKTINLPHSATEEDIEKIYLRAYELDCKGITVFRDGCKSTQVLKTGEAKQEPKTEKAITLPEILEAIRVKMHTPDGRSLYVSTSFNADNIPVEVFATLAKSGTDEAAYTEALGRLISLSLRSGVSYKEIFKTLRGIRGKDWTGFQERIIWSIPDAIAVAIDTATTSKTGVVQPNVAEKPVTLTEGEKKCPECGCDLAPDNKCCRCLNCGWSNCS